MLFRNVNSNFWLNLVHYITRKVNKIRLHMQNCMINKKLTTEKNKTKKTESICHKINTMSLLVKQMSTRKFSCSFHFLPANSTIIIIVTDFLYSCHTEPRKKKTDKVTFSLGLLFSWLFHETVPWCSKEGYAGQLHKWSETCDFQVARAWQS